ncbi:hypothetical protein [Desulfovibrio sp.]|uniref:hypothetical protein n=1 Tax=Desulfovibrio sp. TaxID=885 RepID=UPI0039E618E1
MNLRAFCDILEHFHFEIFARLREQMPACSMQLLSLSAHPSGNGCREGSIAIYLRG